MALANPPLLLSVRPRFARAILDGTKTIEVRRRQVRASAGTRVILYASTPVQAVVGTAWLQQTVSCDAKVAWRVHGHRLGLERDELEAYLDGQPACLLLLRGAAWLPTPVSLAHLRRRTPFHPPQSYRYVSPSDPLHVRRLAR